MAGSTNLVNWVFRRTLDAQATQPAICALPNGGFLTATEFNDQAGSGGVLRFRHHATLSALLAGTVNRQRSILRSPSGCNEGTPNIYSVSLTPTSTARSSTSGSMTNATAIWTGRPTAG